MGKKKVKLTLSQLIELEYCTRVMCNWEVDGAYGDGDKITDKARLKVAQRAAIELVKIFR